MLLCVCLQEGVGRSNMGCGKFGKGAMRSFGANIRSCRKSKA